MIRIHLVTLKAPAGEIWLAGTDRGVMRLGFGRAPENRVPDTLARAGLVTILRTPGPLRGALHSLRSYLAGETDTPRAELDLQGSGAFQRKVLEIVRKIPAGKVLTYVDVARAAGSPRGARAVGRALATNPVPLFVPCHRVLTARGEIADYIGGRAWKRALLDLETQQMRLPAMRRRERRADSGGASRRH